ncbi:hypothetical protein AgCh_035481 [Apium graveolens]
MDGVEADKFFNMEDLNTDYGRKYRKMKLLNGNKENMVVDSDVADRCALSSSTGKEHDHMINGQRSYSIPQNEPIISVHPKIDELLRSVGKSLKKFDQLPQPPRTYLNNGTKKLIIEESSYATRKMEYETAKLLHDCTEEKRKIYDTVTIVVNFQVFLLTENMRLKQGESDCEGKELKKFAKWVLDIGNGQTVGHLNSLIVDKLPGESVSFFSVDTTEEFGGTDEDLNEAFIIEYLNSLNVAGIPPHDLKLKVGDVVLLMHNLNQTLAFTHGQYYVAISRVTSPTGLTIVVDDESGAATNLTQNVVYKEVF